MMAMAEDRLIDRLPPVRGRLSADWPMAMIIVSASSTRVRVSS